MFNFYVNSGSSVAELCEPGELATSDFVHKDQFDEVAGDLLEAQASNNYLQHCMEVYQSVFSAQNDRVQELWSCLEDSEAELEEVRTELEETRQALAEVLSEVFTLISGMMEDYSDPDFQLLQMLIPSIRENYLQKD